MGAIDLPKILICGTLLWAHQDVKEILGEIADVVEYSSQTRREFFSKLSGNGKFADVVGIYRDNTSSHHIGIFDKELIDALPRTVKWIAHNGAGYDQIDVKAAKERGIRVSNTPEVVNDSTATTALYLLISTTRHFSLAERSARAGAWISSLEPGHDPSALTLAILGLGGIGFHFAQLAHAFPMKRIMYHSRHKVEGAPDWVEYYPKERLGEMLKETDILSVHVPLRKDTEGLVDEEMIRGLKRGAIILNTARGKVIDERALIRALEDGHLSAAGLDVYPDEPNINPRLLEFPNVTLLPHVGTYTVEALRGMERRALTNLKDFLEKGAGKDEVPESK